MREKKDIVFLCQFFHPEYISSAQLPFDTAKALQKAGFSVDVVCGYPKEYYTGSPVAERRPWRALASIGFATSSRTGKAFWVGW